MCQLSLVVTLRRTSGNGVKCVLRWTSAGEGIQEIQLLLTFVTFANSRFDYFKSDGFSERCKVVILDQGNTVQNKANCRGKNKK